MTLLFFTSEFLKFVALSSILYHNNENHLPNMVLQIGNKFSEECCKYGAENVTDDGMLSKATSLYGIAIIDVEKEYEEHNKFLSSQVSMTQL
jgi:hypothetical protein